MSQEITKLELIPISIYNRLKDRHDQLVKHIAHLDALRGIDAKEMEKLLDELAAKDIKESYDSVANDSPIFLEIDEKKARQQVREKADYKFQLGKSLEGIE